VKTAPEQFDFCLRLVVPIAALPRPRSAGSNFLRHDNNATALTFHRISYRKLFSFRPLEWHYDKALFIHHVIETIKAVVPESFLAFKRNVCFRGS